MLVDRPISRMYDKIANLLVVKGLMNVRSALLRSIVLVGLTLLANEGGVYAEPMIDAESGVARKQIISTDDKVLFILDCSCEMGEKRLEQAKETLGEIVQALPPNTHWGLRVFGAEPPVNLDYPTPDATARDSMLNCRNTRLVLPIARRTRKDLDKAVGALRILNIESSPLMYTVREAVERDLASIPDGVIVLISQGEDRCGESLPEYIWKTRKFGKTPGRFIVFDMQYKETMISKGLRWIADVTNGKYYKITESDSLISDLRSSNIPRRKKND